MLCAPRARTKVVQDPTHGLGGRDRAFLSHMRERLCEAHSIRQCKRWPPPFQVFLLAMSKEAHMIYKNTLEARHIH